MIKKVIVPMTANFTYSDYYSNYLYKTNVWNIHDLSGIAVGLALGAAFYILFKKERSFLFSGSCLSER
jgi:hypothetical protein